LYHIVRNLWLAEATGIGDIACKEFAGNPTSLDQLGLEYILRALHERVCICLDLRVERDDMVGKSPVVSIALLIKYQIDEVES
jgi:hypothetical protein